MKRETAETFMSLFGVHSALQTALIEEADLKGFTPFYPMPSGFRICVARVPDSTGVRPTDSGDMAFAGSPDRAEYQVSVK